MMKAISGNSSYGSLDGSETHPSSTEAMEADDGMEAAMFATAAVESVASSNNNVAASFGSDDFINIRKQAGDDATAGDDVSTSPQQSPARTDHLKKSRQYYRDMVLGVNDGLVSTFLLVAGVVGGGMDVEATLLTSISGAIAGAISMFAGEYVATKSQNEVMNGEIKLEHEHIANYHQEEMKELSNLFSLIGVPGSSPQVNVADSTAHSSNLTSSAKEARKLRQRMTHYYGSNPDALLKIMIALEFGVIDDETRSPFVAGATSLSLFFVGSLPSVIPFVCVTDSITGLIASGIATAIGLFVVGAVKTWATRGTWWQAALENLLITAAGGGIAYGIGVGFQNLMSEG
jgi:VIT1/CCC1 family predicted Fe2+/Mn2+ transporter